MKLFHALIVLTLAGLATARAQTPCHEENGGANFDDLTSMGGPWVAIKFVAPSSITATRLEVFTGEALGPNTVALYLHDVNGDQPMTQLASGSWNTTSPLNAWQGAQLSAPVPLVSAQTYWFIWAPVGGAQASLEDNPLQLGQVYKASFDNGQSWNGPFQSTTHNWKFRIFCAQGPMAYCTSSTSTNGCVAAITATGNPNVAHSNSCQVSVANVEGQKSGILFYGLMSNNLPWCSMGGGTSVLCVKAPTKRTGVQSSGGTINACNGSLALDWNAYQLANPSALGAPWVAGEKAYVQGWFRDPPSCKTTNLSNGVELTYQP